MKIAPNITSIPKVPMRRRRVSKFQIDIFMGALSLFFPD
jgi:hypothetical protein